MTTVTKVVKTVAEIKIIPNLKIDDNIEKNEIDPRFFFKLFRKLSICKE